MSSGEWVSFSRLVSYATPFFFASITSIFRLLFPSSSQSCCPSYRSSRAPFALHTHYTTPSAILVPPLLGSASLGISLLGRHLSHSSFHVNPHIHYDSLSSICNPLSPIFHPSHLIADHHIILDYTPTYRQMRNGWTTCMVLTPSLWLRIRRGPSCPPTSWIV